MRTPLRIGHYLLEDRLGRGGMGVVWRAIDERLGRPVALKLLALREGDRAEQEARLIREAQAAGALNHPGIVTVHDVGTFGQRAYVVMELVDGRRFTEVIAERPPVARAVALVRQAAEALGYAHARGIHHRDVKPDNLMVTADGRVKVLDFGLAKLREDGIVRTLSSRTSGRRLMERAETDPVTPRPDAEREDDDGLDDGHDDVATDETVRATPPPDLGTDRTVASGGASDAASGDVRTRTGALLGTPAYMAPEQAAGRPSDARTDVFGLGLVLHELLTGSRTLERESLMATLAAAARAEVAPLDDARQRLPRALIRVVERATAADAEARFADAGAMAAALAEVERGLGGRPVATPRAVFVAAFAAAAVGGLVSLYVAGGDEPLVRGPITLTAATPPPPASPPREPPRARRLTFDLGCEELPVFTPDGGTVVFDTPVDGDVELVALDLANGTRRRLTRRAGWDMAASIAPDGRSIAYLAIGAAGRELRVLALDGPQDLPRELGPVVGYPSWTRDGRILHGDAAGAVLARSPSADAAPSTIATLPAGHRLVSAVELSDGTIATASIVTASGSSMAHLGVARPGGEVRLLDAEPVAAGIVPIRAAARGGFYFGELTESFNRVTWRSTDGLRRERLEGIPLVRAGLDVSATGDVVLSTCGPRSTYVRLGHPEDRRRSLPDWIDGAVVSLGGGRIALESNRGGMWQIWSAGLDGSGAALLVAEDVSEPAVSPDGRTLAWTSYVEGRRGIMARPLAGGAVVQVTTGVDDVRPQFRHDGSLVFRRSEGGASRIYRVDPGGRPAPVTEADVAEFVVGRTHDIVALRRATADGAELVVGPLGGPYRPLRGTSAADTPYAFWKRDGVLIVSNAGRDLRAVPLAGGPPVEIWRADEGDAVSQVEPIDDDELLLKLEVYEGDILLYEGVAR